MPRVRSIVLIMSTALAGVGATGVVVAAAQDGEGDKDPDVILADAKRDLAQVKSLRISATGKTRGKSTKLSVDLQASGSAIVSITQGKDQARMIILPKASYLKANAGYWRTTAKTTKKVAALLAGRWVKVPAKSDKTRRFVTEFSPKRLAACLAVNTGSLVKVGTMKIGDQDVVIIRDPGDKPGSAPGRVFVTTTPPIVPLRVTQTGAEMPGGTVSKQCQDSDTTTSGSDVSFSRYNKIPRITAPHGAVTPQQAVTDGGSGGGGTPI